MKAKMEHIWKIKYILPALLVLMISIISFLIMWFSFHSYQEHFIDNLTAEHKNTLSQIKGNIKGIQSEIITISDLFVNNKDFLKIIEEISAAAAFGYTENYHTLEQLDLSIRDMLSHCSFNYEIQFISENDFFYSTDPAKIDVMKLYKEQLWYYDAISSSDDFYWLPSIKINGSLAYDKHYFSLLRFIKDSGGKALGLLMINIPEDVLYNTYCDLILSSKGNIYLVSKEGQIVSHKDKHILGHFYYKMSTFYELFGKDNAAIISKSEIPYLFSKYETDDSSWIIVEEIKFSSIQEPFFNISRTIVIFVLIICFAGIIIALLASKYITSQISQICIAMDEAINGNFNIVFPDKGFFELRTISNACQQFVNKIAELLNDIKKRERLKRITELRFYQMQINPHFMHNTLFSIKCMVDMDRKQEACEMIDSLNSMMKNILNTDQKLTTVKEEIETLRCYISILRKRYSNSFIVNFDIEEKCEKMLILRFLLQPIVENSIFHGFASQKNDGVIYIRAFSSQTHIYLSVEDNGSGISSEILEALNKESSPNSKHLGINNVKARLKLHYDKNADFLIDTQPGKGCKITIILPQYFIHVSNQEEYADENIDS